MTTKRRKADAIASPQTVAEAQAYLSKIGDLDFWIADRKTSMAQEKQESIETIESHYQPDIDDMLAQANLLFLGLKAYAETNPDLFKKQKSIKTDIGTFGYRTSPGALKIPKNQTDAIIEFLKKSEALKGCVKTTETLDKNAIKALPEKQFSTLEDGFSVKIDKKTEFFAASAEVDTERNVSVKQPEIKES